MTDTLECPKCEKTYKKSQAKAYHSHWSRKHGGNLKEAKEAKRQQKEAELNDNPDGKKSLYQNALQTKI